MEGVIRVSLLLGFLLMPVNCGPLTDEPAHAQVSKAYVVQVPEEKMSSAYHLDSYGGPQSQHSKQDGELVILLPQQSDTKDEKGRGYESAASYQDQRSAVYAKYYNGQSSTKAIQGKPVDYGSSTPENYSSRSAGGKSPTSGAKPVDEYPAGPAEGVKYSLHNTEATSHDSRRAPVAYVPDQSNEQQRQYKEEQEYDQHEQTSKDSTIAPAKKVPLVLITIHKSKKLDYSEGDKQASDNYKHDHDSNANRQVQSGSSSLHSSQRDHHSQAYGARVLSNYAAKPISGGQQAESNDALWKPLDKFGVRNPSNVDSGSTGVQVQEPYRGVGAAGLQHPSGYNHQASQPTVVTTGHSSVAQNTRQAQVQTNGASFHGHSQNIYPSSAAAYSAASNYAQPKHLAVRPSGPVASVAAPQAPVNHGLTQAHNSNGNNFAHHVTQKNPTNTGFLSQEQSARGNFYSEATSQNSGAGRSQASVQFPSGSSGYSGHQVANFANKYGKLQGGIDAHAQNINSGSRNVSQNSASSSGNYRQNTAQQQFGLNHAVQHSRYGVQQASGPTASSYQSQLPLVHNAPAQRVISNYGPSQTAVPGNSNAAFPPNSNSNYAASQNANAGHPQRHQALAGPERHATPQIPGRNLALSHGQNPNVLNSQVKPVVSGYGNSQAQEHNVNVNNGQSQGQNAVSNYGPAASSYGHSYDRNIAFSHGPTQSTVFGGGNVQTEIDGSGQGNAQEQHSRGNYGSGQRQSTGQNYGTSHSQNVAPSPQSIQEQIRNSYQDSQQQNSKLSHSSPQIQSVEEKQRFTKQEDTVFNQARPEGQRAVFFYSPPQQQNSNSQTQNNQHAAQEQSRIAFGHATNLGHSQGSDNGPQQQFQGDRGYLLQQPADNNANFKSQQQSNQGVYLVSSGQNVVISKSPANFEQNSALQTSGQSFSDGKQFQGPGGKASPETLLVVLVSAKKNHGGEDMIFDNSEPFPQAYAAPQDVIELAGASSSMDPQIQTIESQAEAAYEQLSGRIVGSKLYSVVDS